MRPRIATQSRLKKGDHLILFISSVEKIPAGFFSQPEISFIKRQHKKKLELIPFNRLDHWVLVQLIPHEKEKALRKELCRKAGDQIQQFLNSQKIGKVVLFDVESFPGETLACAEGMALGSYQFDRYKSRKEEVNTLKEISIFSQLIDRKKILDLNALLHGVCFARDLVNEPHSYLTAPVFAREVEKMARESGINLELLTKKKLEALQMGGILGVNKGSTEPPVMMILEYRPASAKNRKPLVLVGKGIVYDTGGMNLKTGGYMENMKNDMAGGAAVAGAMLAISGADFPCHVIGLIPATDNRPGPGAIVSGDVLKMHNGMTVEVIDTDAEGRLILADALSYAKKYDPALTIDLSTLTGSAIRAIGKRAIAGMQSKAKEAFGKLSRSGYQVYERIVELPLWKDYEEPLKSDIADMKNLGGPEAGAITAGKFLEKFADYPYIHLDIAGPAFLEKRDSYRGKGGTGVGVRLIIEFLKEWD